VKSVTCPNCRVVSQIPDEAWAYKCSNCGREVKLRYSGAEKVQIAGKVISQIGTLIMLLVALAIFGACAYIIIKS
jgi:hypothetical protein